VSQNELYSVTIDKHKTIWLRELLGLFGLLALLAGGRLVLVIAANIVDSITGLSQSSGHLDNKVKPVDVQNLLRKISQKVRSKVNSAVVRT
jgi:hypothetical protein